MLKIKTSKGKTYYWDYEKGLANMLKLALLLIVIVGYLLVSTMEYQSLL